MAKTNKFTSINFNHIYDKNPSPNPNPNPKSNSNTTIKNQSHSSSSSSSSTPFSYSAVSAPKPHGRMVVLTRPTPKSRPSPSPQPQPQQTQQPPPQIRSDPPPDAISLRPLGRTGTGSVSLAPVVSQGRDKEDGGLLPSAKPDKFVPPHLRPGFVGKEERPRPDVIRPREAGHNHSGPPGRYWEDGRPKSGGGRGTMTRPTSSCGNRPNSSGWSGIATNPEVFLKNQLLHVQHLETRESAVRIAEVVVSL